MKKIDSFINQYPLSKTLRFSLLPVGKTEEYFNARLLLEEDEKRAEAYEKVKGYMDRYHKVYIESVLSKLFVTGIPEYAQLYYKSNKTDKDEKEMEKAEAVMRKIIAKALQGTDTYKSIFAKEMIREILPEFLTEKEEQETVEMFHNFATYFTGFNENRRNMYAADEKKSAISYRCINENLPRFLDNMADFKKVKAALSAENMSQINVDCYGSYGLNIQDVFTFDYFNFVLSQSGIDKYNGIIGGYACSDGTKVKGLNEYINLYNQQVAKGDSSKRLPFMKPLYKQILSERETVSFIPEKFPSDNAVINAVNQFYAGIESTLARMSELFADFRNYDLNAVYITSGLSVTAISNAVFGKWSAIVDAWNAEYKSAKPLKKGKDVEKYDEERAKEYKRNKSFSVTELQRLGSQCAVEGCVGDVALYIEKTVAEKIADIGIAYAAVEKLLAEDYEQNNKKKLCKNDSAIELIKSLLDAIKELERFTKSLLGTGKEEVKDGAFYGAFTPLYDQLSTLDRLYDKVRNYVTQKPYSKDKIKLNFENSHFLSGWSQDYDTKGAMIFRECGKYYIGIFDRKYSSENIARLYENAENSEFERVVYDFQKPDNKNTPRLFIRSKGNSYAPAVSQLGLPIDDIIDVYDGGYFKAEYRAVDFDKYKMSLVKMIDYFKMGFKGHESYRHYNFKWKESEQYRDISEFYKDTIESCYELRFEKINYAYINELIENGQLYLFQIYNKDFSPHSKGRPNLHTQYFRMIFDERNLADVVYQLNGGAEMFYRKASINGSEQIVHPANQPIDNKNLNNKGKKSFFVYDIIKDKRFTRRQFSLHIPITLNFKAQGQEFINNAVRSAIKNSSENYVIGIDRGERHLLYISVINSRGEIVEQRSLNEIIGGNGDKVDYHDLLATKEIERDKARKAWGTIENIKELKEGYLSQVIHEICRLVLKYDAVIAMEDLNFGFKNGRFKVEKQVYQKFENMLISKLNYLVDKCVSDPCANGGLLRAYQLTNKVAGVNKGRQNGIIFYVPAWMTSKIDPTTGFVDLLKPKYVSVTDSLAFIERLDAIRYNESADMFEFDMDYSKFPKGSLMYRKCWTLCTNGERIKTFRNSDKNNEWDNEEITITDEFKSLFGKYGVDYSADIKAQLLKITEKSFHYDFIKAFALMLQMRNSITGDTSVDYLISPVRNNTGGFYDSRTCKGSALPENADANGAYNIARKALWALCVLQDTAEDELKTANLSIKNAQWLEMTQK